tara:strand:- start:372 stop:656 length:285 start_codon:yes stop_codon:yes gene_type:complete
MAKHKSLLIILGLILIAVGLALFNALRFWAIISLVVGFIAMTRAITLKSGKKEPENESKEEIVGVEKEPETESEEETENIEEEGMEEENNEDFK